MDDAVIADAVIGALSSATLGGYKAPNVAGGESVQFALDIPLLENFTGLNINKIPGMDSFIESPIGQTSLGLLRFGGTPLLQDLMMQDFTAPQLATTSRFRGYGGY